MKKKNFENRSFFESIKRAFIGLYNATTTEKNYLVYALNVIVTAVINLWIGFTPTEWLIYLLTIVGVFAAECFNTAIEKLCDIVCSEYNDNIKSVKDIASAGVLCFGVAFYITEFVLVGVKLIA